jgi:hypothetical protein
MRRISPDEATRLHLAAIVGDAHLAGELEDLGLADEEESLEDARLLRPMILEEVEKLREGVSEG